MDYEIDVPPKSDRLSKFEQYIKKRYPSKPILNWIEVNENNYDDIFKYTHGGAYIYYFYPSWAFSEFSENCTTHIHYLYNEFEYKFKRYGKVSEVYISFIHD